MTRMSRMGGPQPAPQGWIRDLWQAPLGMKLQRL
jgi:hypothetical protein